MTTPESPLMTVAALAARLDDPRLRIVDVRWVLGRPGAGRIAYDEGHLPGATFLDLDGDLALAPGPGRPGRHPLPSPAAFARRLGAAGIGTDDLVVGYDDVGGWVAARLWWMLDVLGHHRVAVLDGGFQAWQAGGLSVSTETPVAVPAELELAGAWRRVIDRSELKTRLGSVILLDARGAPRYRGEVEPIDAYPGHIPTATSAPTDGNLTAPNGRFMNPEELRRRFALLGVAGSDRAPGAAGSPAGAGPGTPGALDVVTSCGSGVSACHHALAMRIAGLPDPILYEGSYSDWSAAGEPVAVGPERGTWADPAAWTDPARSPASRPTAADRAPG